MKITNIPAIFATNFRNLTLMLGSFLLIVLMVSSVKGQSSTDGTTPLGLSPGSPSGSYPLSDLDTVNLYNGSLNFRLPLIQIAGRGGAGYPLTLHVEKKWTVFKHIEPGVGAFYYADEGWWSEEYEGWKVFEAGKVNIRSAYRRSPPNSGPVVETLTRITFTAPDGTEYELRDQLTNGQFVYPQPGGFNRGRTFVTADGSTATFVSDWDILDDPNFGQGFYDDRPDGYLMFRDGTRFQVLDGKITWMRDRNGNKVSFTYDPFRRVTSVTDSLNRQVTITYPSQTEGFTQINFKGFGGAPRTIKIGQTSLANALRSGYTLPPPGQYFPELNGGGPANPVVSYIELPDGRRFQLQYNPYAELARVVLPTGGAIEYDHAAGLTDGAASGVFSIPGNKYIYRRVIERRIYPDGGTGAAYESKMTYSRPETTIANLGYVISEQRTPSGTLLAKSIHYFYGSPRASFSQWPTQYPAWADGREYQTEIFHTDGTTILRKVNHTFAQRAPVSWWTGAPDAAPPNDPRTIETVTTIEPGGANLVSKQTFGFDDSVPFNNQNNLKEYDFGVGAAGALLRETRTTFLTASGYTGNDVHLRSLPLQVSIHDAGGVERARTTHEYDNYANDPPNHAPLVNRLNISGFDSSFNTNYVTRGNATATTSCLLNNGIVTGSITNYAQYDIAGNSVKTVDARGFATLFEFDDRYGSPNGEAQAFGGSAELGSQVSYAFATKVTNPQNHIVYTQLDYYLGKPVDAEDANGVTFSGHYSDALDRPTQVIRAANQGTSVKSQTTFAYDDVNRIITSTSDLNAYGDNLLKGQTLYDLMGRTIETRQYEGGTNYIAVKKEYDALGRAFKTSNPYRPWLSENPIWTISTFDALGRVLTVTTPDNSVVTTSYSGNTVTVTDQIGKKRKSVTDALGRLKEVYEDPLGLNYQTSYSYDVLDDLTTVTQGAQTRTFVYDSLKRLTSATNPESGTNSYQYDNNGNLTQKTDARSIVTTYVYDALNRNTSVDYSDTTPDSFRQYDLATNGKGRVNQVWQAGTTTSATYIDSYDALGRPLIQRQRYETGGVWSSSYQTQRSYNLAGNVTSQTYPSGRTVNYGYDNAGRLNSFTGYLGDGVNRNYSTEIVYSPLGGMAKEKFGTDTALYNKSFYNSRGQLSEIRVGTTYTGPTDGGWERGAIINHYSGQCWGACNGTDNNGNLKQQDHWINDGSGGVQGLFVQSYTYDSLNRLQRVVEGSWQQEFVYDRWGNRTIHQTNTWGTGINKKDFTVDTANNRLGVPAGQSGVMTYDNAGNLTNDTYTGAGSRVYDAENRMTKAWGGNNQWQEYSYNADGQRTRRKIDGVEAWQIYGMDGELLAEYAASAAPASPQKEYGYRNGQLIVTATVPITSGTGLQGQYFDNMNFTDLKVTRTDATVDFDWGLGTPDSSLGVDTFTVRWQGRVEPQYSQTYTFYTHSDDGVRLWVNGQLLIDKWIDQGPTEWSGQIALTAGQRYDIVMEFYENGGGAMAKLWWSSASQPKQIIPQSRLYPPGSSSQVAVEWLVADQLGTPRMIFDKTGSLATTKRHDYLPFGEELFAGVGGRTTALGYTSDTVRQKFTQKERDNETGLDFFEARYYASMQGRFTSTDPIMITVDRLMDPQEMNLYHYARNNPLRFSDPTGEDIDDSALDKNEEYQKWKKAYLATKAGQAEWNKYANDHSVNITISMGTNAGGQYGAETTPTFDANGKFTGATIVLGTNFAQRDTLNSSEYPVSSSMTETAEHSNYTIDRTARAVAFFAHEFGHVDDAQKQGAIWVQQTELLRQNKEGFETHGQLWLNTVQYKRIVFRLGDTPANVSTGRENRAEAAVIPVMRDYYAKGAGHGSMPSRVKQAIQNYEKAHPR